MAKIRVGFSSDFNVRDTKVGFGTTNPAALLDVPDTLKADLNIAGVATLTAYGGFVGQRQYIKKPAKIGVATVGVGTFQQYYETETGFTNLGGVHHGDDQKFNTLSEDLIIDDGEILNITNISMFGTKIGGKKQDSHNHSSYVCAGSLEQVSVTGHFSVPSGGINDRQLFIEGTVRFNTDLNTLEFFNGVEWRQFTYNQGHSGGSRAYFAGGTQNYPTNSYSKNIDLVNIQSGGNATAFGELTQTMGWYGICSSATRGVLSGTNVPATNRMEYFTLASGGTGFDFGTQSAQRYGSGGFSSSTRGVYAGGWSPSGGANLNVMDYIEIHTLGNALDFGDTTKRRRYMSAMSSPVRGVLMGGISEPVARRIDIDFSSIASKGNAVTFGYCAGNSSQHAGCSNGVRGIGAYSAGNAGEVTRFQTVNIATTGNAEDFGYLDSSRYVLPGFACDKTRAVYAGGFAESPSVASVSEMDVIDLTVGGLAIDFGDLTQKRALIGGCSDSHGGLGGF